MKKILMLTFILLVVFIAACKPAQKEVMEKTTTTKTTTTDPAVEEINKDLGNVDSIDKDLSVDAIGDIDSGLNDIDTI